MTKRSVRAFEKRRIERIRDAIAETQGEEVAESRCALIELLDEYDGDPLHHCLAALDRGDDDHARAIRDQCVAIGLWKTDEDVLDRTHSHSRRSAWAG